MPRALPRAQKTALSVTTTMVPYDAVSLLTNQLGTLSQVHSLLPEAGPAQHWSGPLGGDTGLQGSVIDPFAFHKGQTFFFT